MSCVKAVADVVPPQPILLLSNFSSSPPVQVHLAKHAWQAGVARGGLSGTVPCWLLPALHLMLPAVLWRALIQALRHRLCCIPCEI